MREGKRHGYGWHKHSDGTNYRGMWVDGERHGFGKEENTLLEYKYTGNFTENQKEGFGCQEMAGEFYQGYW